MSLRRLRGPALAAASLLFALLAAEVAHRAWLRSRGTPFDRAALEERLDRAANTTASFVPGGRAREDGPGGPKAGRFGILHPFTGSEHHHDTGDVLRSFRERPEDDDSFVVLVVGGSVAASWSADLNDAFARRLEADPRLAGRRVRVLPFAHAAYKQPQQVTRLAYLLSFGYRPDVVINLDGFNELAASVSNALEGTNPNYPSTPVWGAVLRDRRDLGEASLDALVELRAARDGVVSFVETARRFRLSASSLASVFVERRIDALRARSAAAMERYRESARSAAETSEHQKRQMYGPPFDDRLPAVLEAAVTCWFEGSLSLQALCEQRDVVYVHCLQPTLFDPGAKRISAEERAIGDGPPGWRAAVERGYPMLRERGAELAGLGVAFHDVSRSFADVEQTLYFDECHFHGAGNLILSEKIAAHVLAALPPPR